jgi:hypothetical protein
VESKYLKEIDFFRLPSITLHVWIALWLSPSLPTSEQEIATRTGLHLRTVRLHLRRLEESGLAVRAPLGRSIWTTPKNLAESPYYTPLVSALRRLFYLLIIMDHHHNQYIEGENGSENADSGRFNADSGMVITDFSQLTSFFQSLLRTGQNSLGSPTADFGNPNTDVGKQNTDSGTLPTNGKAEKRRSIPLPDHPLREVLARHGIHWNWKTVRLANCEWVTPEYIAAHVKARPKELGLTITLMLRGEPAPESAEHDDYYDIDFD